MKMMVGSSVPLLPTKDSQQLFFRRSCFGYVRYKGVLAPRNDDVYFVLYVFLKKDDEGLGLVDEEAEEDEGLAHGQADVLEGVGHFFFDGFDGDAEVLGEVRYCASNDDAYGVGIVIYSPSNPSGDRSN